MDSQFEIRTPYIIYKDAANGKSNQKNLGVVKSSNLAEIWSTLMTKNMLSVIYQV